MDTLVVWEGEITEFSWRAPHVYLKAKVVDSGGVETVYTVEAGSPPAMSRLGWSKSTFAPGDFIRWEGNPDRDPNRPYTGIEWAENEDGAYLPVSIAASKSARAAAVVPEEVAEPATQIGEGRWWRIGADGKKFKNIYGPPDDWPLTEKGVQNIREFSEADNPIIDCYYGGPPRSILSLLGFQWSRPDADTVLIDRDLWPQPRVVYINNAPPKGEPTGFGYSVGRWDGDQLLVETDNFVAETWGLYSGIDSSDQKKVSERYWLSENGLRLNVEVTVTDPEYLTQPHTFTHQWRKLPDAPMVKAECSVETANYYRTAGYEEANPSVVPQSSTGSSGYGAVKYLLAIAGLATAIFLFALYYTRP